MEQAGTKKKKLKEKPKGKKIDLFINPKFESCKNKNFLKLKSECISVLQQ